MGLGLGLVLVHIGDSIHVLGDAVYMLRDRVTVSTGVCAGYTCCGKGRLRCFVITVGQE